MKQIKLINVEARSYKSLTRLFYLQTLEELSKLLGLKASSHIFLKIDGHFKVVK